MLNKTIRLETLKNKLEITLLFQNGKRIKTKDLQVVYLKKNQENVRLLYCTEKKVNKAHDRNRVKRVLRAIALELKNLFPGGFDIALISNLEFTFRPFDKRVKEVEFQIKKIR